MIGTTKMTDEEIEAMVRNLIKQHLATCEAALDLLERRAAAYRAIQELGLLDGGQQAEKAEQARAKARGLFKRRQEDTERNDGRLD